MVNQGANMKRLLLLVLCLFSAAAYAQTCDVTYISDVETAAGNDVAYSSAKVYGLPMADVLDNNVLGKKVLNEASKRQDQGGPYTLELSEIRECNGGPPARADGIMVKGVTLKGANAISREALRQADRIVQRYEKRAAKGDKAGWDHGKARKTKRNDLGQKQP
jgi:hypothetical protein